MSEWENNAWGTRRSNPSSDMTADYRGTRPILRRPRLSKPLLHQICISGGAVTCSRRHWVLQRHKKTIRSYPCAPNTMLWRRIREYQIQIVVDFTFRPPYSWWYSSQYSLGATVSLGVTAENESGGPVVHSVTRHNSMSNKNKSS